MYHLPVLLSTCIQQLQINPKGTYIDLTFGGGGHSKEILKNLHPEGKLIAFDQDEDAAKNVENLAQENFIFIPANFRNLEEQLHLHKIEKVDGILADLGISSHQIDTPERGFSTRFQANLDMRMDQKAAITAHTILHKYSESQLHKILGMYGEVKNAKTLANALINHRAQKNIATIDDLKDILLKFAPKNQQHKYFAQVFQALRIEVNEELKALEEMLMQTANVLIKGGRLVIMSYHSLEDRLVKNFMQKGKFTGELEKDFFGNPLKPFKMLTSKPILPSQEEIMHNNRARSAKLRVAERI